MSQSKLTHRTGRLLACGLLAGSLAFSASAQDDTPMIVSPELFSALGGWSEASSSVLSVALDESPEAIYLYTDELRDAYRGLTVAEHFEKKYPETFKAYLEMTEQKEVQDPADFVAFVMATEDRTFSKWQQERELEGNTFDAFINRNFPEIAQRAEREKETPAARGISMSEYVRTLDNEKLSFELDRLLDKVKGTGVGTPKSLCQCWTIASFIHQPDPWQVEPIEDYDHEWGWPKKKEELDFYTAGRGAGKDYNFRRKSRRTLYEVSRSRTNYDSAMHVRMHCTQNGQIGGVNCQGSTCVGELAMRTAYASRVYEKVDVGGVWSKRSRMRVGDAAALLFDPPGPAPEQRLFEKGVAVAGDVKTNWSAENGLTLLQTVAQVGMVLATDGSSAASLLEGNLLDETYNAIIGLIKREGSEGSKQVDMHVAYDTVNTAPFSLLPNTTLAFNLDTGSEIYSRGYGGTSEGWGNIDSSHYMAGVARNYQCAPNVAAPAPQSFWLWSGGPNAPQSSTTLQNLVRNWVSVELGTTPPNTNQQRGAYP